MNIETFAPEWIAAWNSHDLERILSHYSDDVTVTSAFAERVRGPGTGDTVRGKAALRAYWGLALERFTTLRFELLQAYPGVDSLVLTYHSVAGLIGAEYMRFDASGRVCEVRAHYVKA